MHQGMQIDKYIYSVYPGANDSAKIADERGFVQ